MLTENEARQAIGNVAVSSDDEELGTVEQLVLDEDSGRPEFVTVRTGLLGRKETFLPAAEATWSEGRLSVPYSKDKVTAAPTVDADGGRLDEATRRRLYEHYELSYDDAVPDDLSDRGAADPASLGLDDA